MNLSRYKWVRYVPDIGNNRELETPLLLEVRTGLSRDELRAWSEAVAKAQQPVIDLFDSEPNAPEEKFLATKAATDAEMARVISENVRLVGTHTVDGEPLETMAQYLAIVDRLATSAHAKELIRLVPHLNTLREEDALFSERLSGGLATTPRRSAAKSAGPTGDR